MTTAYFNGFMCPVFTIFDDDGRVVFDTIDQYCRYLKNNGVLGVLINGTTGEGTCLDVEERKQLAEEWKSVCVKYGVKMMLQVGGCSISDVYDLAKHAERIRVDYVLCLPELYFKPKTEADLVNYFKEVAACCPSRPIYYYHIPRMTGVDLNMAKFCELAEEVIPTFRGLKYTSGDMEMATQLLKPSRNILLGSDVALICAFSLGINSAILTTLNICPAMVQKIYEYWVRGDFAKALDSQKLLNIRVSEILANGSGEWVESMKKEFNLMNIGFSVGPTRKI